MDGRRLSPPHTSTKCAGRASSTLNACCLFWPALSLFILSQTVPGLAQTAAPSAGNTGSAAPATSVYVRDWTRVEMWHFFEPKPGGGDPGYVDISSRLQAGFEHKTEKYELSGALQFVQFGGLPTAAVGPGPLGTGPLYYAQGGNHTDSRGLYLRYLNAKLKDITPGWSIQAGRMGYTSGAESSSGDVRIEAVKRQRVDSRLLGEFEWSLYQRAYDGVRTDVDQKHSHITAAAFHPTQGGFENNGNVDIADISVYAAQFAMKPNAMLRHSDWEVFAIRYDDTRAVAARPDNSGRTASEVRVHVTSVGTMLAGVYPVAAGRHLDVLLWTAAQTGDWYGQDHSALALTAESGLQWSTAPWKPWIRGGFTYASGDSNASDQKHASFFQVLPTVRKYSLSATYSLMNLRDTFVQLLATPRSNLTLRVDLHRLTLANGADRWYVGSGATQSSGTTFGYATRASNGYTGLGTATEGSVDYHVNRHWSMNGYIGCIRGGSVVTALFAGQTLAFGYVENVLQF